MYVLMVQLVNIVSHVEKVFSQTMGNVFNNALKDHSLIMKELVLNVLLVAQHASMPTIILA